MAQIDELVKRARTIGEIADNDLSAAIDIGDECADAIDRLQARVAELEKEATRLAEQVRGYNSVVVKRTADCDRLQARVAELEKENERLCQRAAKRINAYDSLRKERDDYKDRAITLTKACERLLTEGITAIDKLDRAKEALLPFSEAAKHLDDDFRDVSEIWEHSSAMSITGGDIRRAAAVLAELSADAPAQQTTEGL